MTKDQLEKIELTKRLPKDEDFWYNNLMGVALTTMFIVPFIFIAFDKSVGVSFVTHITATLVFGLVVYAYWRDMGVSFIQTKWDKKENFRRVADCLRALKWEFHRTGDVVRIWTPNQTFLLRQVVDADIYIYDNKIGYTFRYGATTRTGRLIFMFGIRTYLKRRFEKKLHTTIGM
jgi:hypothetical protein